MLHGSPANASAPAATRFQWRDQLMPVLDRDPYSTVTPDEQRESIGNVVQLFGRAPAEGRGPSGEESGEGPAKVGRK